MRETILAFFTKQIDRLKQNTFVKSVLTLSAGVVVSQSVALITTPIISRIYDPEVLGDFSIITSNASIIGVFVCLGLMTAIMVPKEDDEAKGLCRLLTTSIIGLTSLLLLAALALSRRWQMFSVNLDYRIACLILWLYIVLNNISSVCYAYVNRQKMYKVLFWNPTIGTVSNAVVSIGLGLLGCGLWGYTCGNLLAMVLNIVHMLRHVSPYKGKLAREYRAVPLLKKHKDFPLVLLPSNFIGTFAQQTPIQMLSRFWGNTVVGSYSMCLTILGLPTKFLAGPVNRVFYREATERANRGENIGEFTIHILEVNIKLAIVPIVILILFGSPLFSFVLGDKWGDAGAFASVLGIYQLMAFCNSCLSGKFVVINRKKTILILNVAALVVYASTFLICHFLNLSAFATITIYAVVGALFELVDTFIFMYQTKANLHRYCRFVFLFLVAPTVAATALRVILF